MKKYFIIGLLTLAPSMVFAATAGTILGVFSDIIGTATPIVVALALLFFFWGLAMYIWKTGEGKAEGKDMMIWGIIALFVMVSVWGLVQVVRDTFGVQTATITIPGVVSGTSR